MLGEKRGERVDEWRSFVKFPFGSTWFINTLLSLFLALILSYFVNWLLLKLEKRFQLSDSPWKKSGIKTFILPAISMIWLTALLKVAQDTSIEFTGNPFVSDPKTVLRVGYIVLLGWFLLRWKKAIVLFFHFQSHLGKMGLEKGKIDAIDKLATLIIYIAAIFLLLEQMGSSVNTLVAFGGISGLALAFASQQIIANFFGGLMIYFTQPFSIGDWIQLPEKNIDGHVEEIGWYMTCVRTFDKRPLFIPNSILANVLVVNPSRMTHRQIKQMFHLRYEDLQKVPPIILEIENLCHSHPKMDHTLPPQVHLTKFDERGIQIDLSTYIAFMYKDSYNDLNEEILLGIASIIEKQEAKFAIPVAAIEFPRGLPMKGFDFRA